MFTLASIHSAQKHYADAEPLLMRALALQEKMLPPGHVNMLMTLVQLAMVEREQGEFKESETFYRRAVAIHEEPADLVVAIARTLWCRKMARHACISARGNRIAFISEEMLSWRDASLP
jgi:hypothetical protein